MFCNLKIFAKMLIGFSLVAVIAGLIGLLGIIKINQVKNIGTEMYTKDAQPLGILVQLGMDSQKARVNLRGMMLDNDRERMEANAEGVRKRYEDIERLMAEFEKNIEGENSRREFAETKALIASYKPVWQEIVRLQLDGKNSDALELMRSKGLSTEKDIEAAIRKMIDIKIGEAKGRDDRNAVISKSAIIQTLIYSAIGMLVALILGTFFARMITRPIREVVVMAEKIADGDLTHEVVSNYGDETGQLSRAMNAMTGQLNSLLQSVANNSNRLTAAAGELTTDAEQIASGTEIAAEQAGTVSTSSEEMASTSMDIARNCLHAAEGAKAASNSASEGAVVVQETVDGMTRISDRVRESAAIIEALGVRSNEIGAIIETIEDIAEQTNLLALNAAIEAARAGEQGRGFAVVADEVRALAERTTKATKEIGTMIKAIQKDTCEAVSSMESGVKEVAVGMEGASRSGSALTVIIEQINEVTLQVNQIATAAEEQTATTNEISSNIQRMTQVIHQAADGAIHSASAARQLSALADDLQHLVGRFRLKG